MIKDQMINRIYKMKSSNLKYINPNSRDQPVSQPGRFVLYFMLLSPAQGKRTSMTSLNLPFSSRTYFGGSYVDKCAFVVSGARKGPPSDFIYKTAVKVASAACRQRKKRHRYFQTFSIFVVAPPHAPFYMFLLFFKNDGILQVL